MTKPTELQERQAFYEGIEAGQWSLPQTLKNMRKIARMTQVEYAHFVGVAPRIVIDLERGVGNPTLASLEKLTKPFGLKVGFLPKT